MLLAEVFEEFQTNCLNTYELDCAHYYTTPGFSQAAMLKYTKDKLKLLDNIEMIWFIEKGISHCSNRYAVANNPHMKPGNYDATKPTR